jgi:trigger factor
MMVSVETVGGLERRMKVQVPAERIEKEVDSRLQRVGKTAKIKGFRPGKVPMKVIRQRYGGQVRQEVLGEVMQMSYFEAISQEKLRPAGHPRIEPGNTGQGEDLEYVATFEVYPEVALQGHEDLAVEKPVAEIGKIDGEAFPGGSGEDVPVVLGQGGMLPDFENGLIGMRAGDEKDITVTFPDDYGAENLAGRTADFHVTARRVETQKLPEIDDDFCAAFGIGEGGVAKLREEVLDSMRRELEQTVQSRLKEQIMQGLLDRNEVELPGSLVDDEIRSLREAAARRMGVDPSDPNNLPPRESFEAVAQRRVKLGLLVAEVIRQAGIELDKERVRERVRRLAADYRDPEEVVKLYTGNRQLMDQLEMEVMEEQVVDWLIERAEISEKDIGFKELMRPE